MQKPWSCLPSSFGRARQNIRRAARASPCAQARRAGTWRRSGYVARGEPVGKSCRARPRRGCR
eukprot:2387670-Pleurochrysis_carterae.AAC.1